MQVNLHVRWPGGARQPASRPGSGMVAAIGGQDPVVEVGTQPVPADLTQLDRPAVDAVRAAMACVWPQCTSGTYAALADRTVPRRCRRAQCRCSCWSTREVTPSVPASGSRGAHRVAVPCRLRPYVTVRQRHRALVGTAADEPRRYMDELVMSRTEGARDGAKLRRILSTRKPLLQLL